MPDIKNRRHLKYKPAGRGNDQTMGLAEKQRVTALRIAAAKEESRPFSERLAAIAARSNGKPCAAQCRRATGNTVVETVKDRKHRAGRGYRLALAAASN